MTESRRIGNGFLAIVVAAALAAAVAALALLPGKAFAIVNQVSATENSITITWDKPTYVNASSIQSYTIEWGPYSGTQTTVVNAGKQNSFVIGGLVAGTKYTAKVNCNYTTSSSSTSTSCGSNYSLATRVTKPAGLNQVKWWHFIEEVQFGWNKQEAATAVEYKIVNSKTGKVIESKTSTYASDTFTSSKVKNTVLYYVQMRVQDKYGWSEWSDKAYLFTQPMVKEKKTKVSGSKLTVVWDKIVGADNYEVYASTKEKKGYKKLKTVKATKNKITASKLGGKKFSPKKKYYVYVVAKKKAGGQTYTSGRLYSCQVKGKNVTLKWSF